MQPDRFTIKSQEALSSAISAAHERRHSQVLPEHLLSALLDAGGGLTRPVLNSWACPLTA